MTYKSQKTILLYSLLLIGGVLAFDTLVDVSIVAPVAYSAAVLVALGLRSLKAISWLTVFCAALTLLRMVWISDGDVDSFYEVWTNRLLSIFVILVTAALGLDRKKAEIALEKAQNELEQRVIERTQELAETNQSLTERTVELDKTNQSLMTEIDDRIRAEKANQRLEDRTRIIIDHAVDAIVTIDDGGAIVTWNSRAEELFGWPAYEVLGELLVDLILPKKDRRAHRIEMRNFLKSQTDNEQDEPSPFEGQFINQQVEITVINRAGDEIPVEISIVPVPWEETFLFSGFIRDLRPARQVERRARESQLLAETIIDTVTGPMIVLDLQLNVQSANRAFYKLFDIEPVETKHHSIYEVNNGEFDFEEFRSLLEAIQNHTESESPTENASCRKTFGSQSLTLTPRGVYREIHRPQFIIVTFEEKLQHNTVT